MGGIPGTQLVGLALLSPSLIIQLPVWGQTPTTVPFSFQFQICKNSVDTNLVVLAQHWFSLDTLVLCLHCVGAR